MKTDKPETPQYFYRNDRYKNGLDSRCKKCTNDYLTNFIEVRREYGKIYKMNNLAICNEHKRVWDKNNPEKVKAQQRVSSHPDKVIIIYECGCNYPKKEEHHPDYSKPLEVCKLCRTCHIEEHKRLKRL